MSNKYPCETCDHYRRDKGKDRDYDRCLHSHAKFNFCFIERQSHNCGGWRHSAYVSVWRRFWNKLSWRAVNWNAVDKNLAQLTQTPEYNFETKEHVAGSWR